MSGMEAWEAVGLAANVLQIIGFAADCAERVAWCFGKGQKMPQTVQEVSDTLPLLEEILKKAGNHRLMTALKHETKADFLARLKALTPTIKKCEDDAKKLRKYIKKVVPEKKDSTSSKLMAAWEGIIKDGKMETVLGRIKNHLKLIQGYINMDKQDFMIRQQEVIIKEIKEIQQKMPDNKKVEEGYNLLAEEIRKNPAKVTKPVEELAVLFSQTSDKQNEDHARYHAEVVAMLEALATARSSGPTREDITSGIDNIPPARRVTDFVPRPIISDKISELCYDPKNTERTVVLQGMGGQGKTVIAMAFAKDSIASKRFDSVFWVDASSVSTVNSSYEEIADRLIQPALKFESDKARKDFVERRLKDWKAPWLMIFDNFDDPDAYKGQALQDFMPQAGCGHFLITSRLGSVALDRFGGDKLVIPVGPMQEQEASKLLFKRTKAEESAENTAHAIEIVKRLGCHALAIDLAGAYILGMKVPLGDFIGQFNQEAHLILNGELPGVWQYRRRLNMNDKEEEISLNVFTSWELSFQQLRPDDEGGRMKAYVLTLLAFLHSRELSETIFEAQSRILERIDYPDWIKSFVHRRWEHSKFVGLLAELKEMSLITDFVNNGKKVTSISMHPLVKDWIKLRLSFKKQCQFTLEAAEIVRRFLAHNQNDVAAFTMRLDEKSEALSCVVACQENFILYGDDPDDPEGPKVLGEATLADTGLTFALFYEFMGNINEAENLFSVVIDWQKRHLDKNDKDLLRSKSLFTEVLRLQKNFKAAAVLDREVYDARMSMLRPGERLDEDTLWSAHDLGWDLEALGMVEEAEKLQRIAYEGRKDLLGQNKPLTLQSVNNLAHTLRRQGKTIEALTLMKETLNIGKTVFNTEHHSELLQFMSNLQDVLRFQGQLAEAEDMARESYDATVKEWGKDHLKAAASRGQLKDILWDRGDAEAAEEVARDNLRIMAESPYSTDISRIDDIALLLDTLSGRQMTGDENSRDKARSEDITKYANEALNLIKLLKPETLKLPSTLQDAIYLSTGLEVLRASKQLVELEPIIYTNCKQVFGLSDRNCINSGSYAARLDEVRRITQHLKSEVVPSEAIKHNSFGSEVNLLVRLSSALRMQGDKAEADRYCQEAINELRKNLDEVDASSPKSTHLAALSWLAVLYKHVGNRRKAMEVYDRAFDFVNQGDFIKTADYETLYSIQGLAEDIDDQRRCQKAEILHKAVLKAREERYHDHPCVDDSLYAYSWNLRLQDRLTEAESVCQRALKIAERFRGPHRNTMCILKRLAYLEEQLGNHELAEGHYRQVLDGFRALGTRHMTRVTEALEDLQELLMEQRKWREARDLIQDAINRRSTGWDRNMGHHAGLIRHLAIVTWELGDGVEGLRLYREARKTYELAWGLKMMPEGPQKQKLISRINELLPGTENMEEEMRIEKEENEAAAAKQIANDASGKENADLDAADDGQETPKQAIIQNLKTGLEQVNQSLASHGATQVTYDGKTNQYQTSTKNNEEAIANYDAPDVSLSRSSTLGVNSFPEAPGNEPSKLDNQDPTVLADITRQMDEANLDTV